MNNDATAVAVHLPGMQVKCYGHGMDYNIDCVERDCPGYTPSTDPMLLLVEMAKAGWYCIKLHPEWEKRILWEVVFCETGTIGQHTSFVYGPHSSTPEEALFAAARKALEGGA